MATPTGTGLRERLFSLRGSYTQPLVGAYTPFTRVGILPTPTGEERRDWPPDIDSERLQQYEHYLALMENRPWDVFPDLPAASADSTDDRLLALAVALPELIANVWPDSVWNDPPNITWENDTWGNRWAELWADNGGDGLGWESMLGAAFRGTSVLQVRRDTTGAFEQETRIEEIEPALYFPVVEHRRPARVFLAWEEDRDPYGTRPEIWQVREHHHLEGDDYIIDYDERRKGQNRQWKTVRTDREEGLGLLPFVELHGARWAGRYWGMSELARIDGLVAEVDARISRISAVLDYHGDPLLQVPASAMPGGSLMRGVNKALGIRNPDEADIARYITWEAMASAQFQLLDKAVEYAFLTTEVPPTYFGYAEGGSLSGTALKLRLQNYLKKASRWQRREESRLRNLARVVGAVERQAPEATAIRQVEFGSPLPADDEQEARIESMLFGDGLTSRKLAIRRLRRVEAEDLDIEVTAAEADQGANAPLPGGTPPAGLGAATNLPPGGAPTPAT
jgi:hypothetical protein